MNVKFRFRCPQKWDSMSGDDQTRHCSMCDKHVYKLNDRSEEEAAAIIASRTSCVSMTVNHRGEIKTASGFSKGLLLMGLALGCGSDTKETPKPTQNNGAQTTQSTTNTATTPPEPYQLLGDPEEETLDEGCENTEKNPDSVHHVLGGKVAPAPDTVQSVPQRVDTPTTPKKETAPVKEKKDM